MNIAIISPEFPPYTNWGGIATFNCSLAKLLSEMGHNVHVITYDGKGDKYWFEKTESYTVHYIKFKTNRKIINVLYYKLLFAPFRYFLMKHLPNLLFAFEWNVFSMLAFQKLHKKIVFDCLSSPSYFSPALFISFKYRKLLNIVFVQGPQEYFNRFEPRSLDNYLKSKIESITMQMMADKIVVCSKDIKKKILKSSPNLREKILYVPNFIEKEIYENKEKLHLNNLVYWGRFEYRKGVDLVLQAFKKVGVKYKNLKLYLIGSKEEKILSRDRFVDFDSYLKSLNLSKDICKRIYTYPRIDDRKSLIELISKIKGIAIFPSRYEPFGFVYIESMAIGNITVASSKGGGSEIIKDGENGFLTDPEISVLIKVLHSILQMSALQTSELLHNAKVQIQNNYSSKSVKQQFQQLYIR